MNSLAFLAGHHGEPLLASAGDDGGLRLHAPFDRTPAPPGGETRWVSAIALSPADQAPPLLVSTERTAVRVWHPVSGVPSGELLAGHGDTVETIALAALPDGGLIAASAGADRTVRLWDPRTGTAVREPLTGFGGTVRSVAFGAMKGDREAKDGRLLLAAAGDDPVIRVVDAISGESVVTPLTGHAGWVDALAFTSMPDGAPLLASAGGDQVVRLWDALAGTSRGQPLAGHGGAVYALAFHGTSRGLMLASAGDDTTVRLWDPLTGDAIGDPLVGHLGWIRALAFLTLGDGTALLASGSADQTVRVWDPASGVCLLTLRRAGAVRALSATGLTLAIGEDDGLTVITLDPARLTTSPHQ